jgi:replication-associated recombination protein RarA
VTDRPPPTRHGIEFDVAASALQKSLRRSLEEESAWWAIEMARSGFGAYVWRRLMVVASEDVGIGGAPGVVADVRALYESWLDARSRRPSD